MNIIPANIKEQHKRNFIIIKKLITLLEGWKYYYSTKYNYITSFDEIPTDESYMFASFNNQQLLLELCGNYSQYSLKIIPFTTQYPIDEKITITHYDTSMLGDNITHHIKIICADGPYTDYCYNPKIKSIKQKDFHIACKSFFEKYNLYDNQYNINGSTKDKKNAILYHSDNITNFINNLLVKFMP